MSSFRKMPQEHVKYVKNTFFIGVSLEAKLGKMLTQASKEI